MRARIVPQRAQLTKSLMAAAQRQIAVTMTVRDAVLLHAHPQLLLPCNSLVRVSLDIPHRTRTTVPHSHKGMSYRVAMMDHKIVGAIPATIVWRVVLDCICTTIISLMLS